MSVAKVRAGSPRGWVVAGVLTATAIGIALRLARLDETLLGDELSTLYIVDGNGLGDIFSSVSSDAEISPPLYFVISWLTTNLGSAPELVRLPSLLAGIASIPLTYLVGARAVGRGAGVIASLVMALSPFMVFYSTDGRAYAVAIFLLLLSTLAMLLAVEGGRTRWWVVYGAATCLAMYTHYTVAFVLGAQLLWLLWAHPDARRPALLANLAAAVLYIPWIPGLLDDMSSPTIDILSVLQGDGLEVKLTAVEGWAIGLPYVDLSQVPGHPALVVAIAGVGLATMIALARWWTSGSDGRPPISKGVVLVLALCLATPVAEALLLALGGTDLFSARNLNTSSAGLALAIGAALASTGALIGAILTVAVIGAYSVATVRVLDKDHQLVDAETAGAFVDAEATPSDVVVDGVTFTPVPLTPLDTTLPQTRPEFRLNLPEGEPPYLPLTSVIPDTADVLPEAFAAAAGNRLFLLARSRIVPPSDEYPNGAISLAAGRADNFTTYPLPEGVAVVETEPVPGYLDASVTVFEVD